MPDRLLALSIHDGSSQNRAIRPANRHEDMRIGARGKNDVSDRKFSAIASGRLALARKRVILAEAVMDHAGEPNVTLYISERARVVYLTLRQPVAKEWLDNI